MHTTKQILTSASCKSGATARNAIDYKILAQIKSVDKRRAQAPEPGSLTILLSFPARHEEPPLLLFM
jgi:hypothetical protein